MIKEYIFDTSVWIDFFNGNKTDQTRLLVYLLENDLPVYYCPVILQEVLQRIKKDSELEEVKEVFTVLTGWLKTLIRQQQALLKLTEI